MNDPALPAAITTAIVDLCAWCDTEPAPREFLRDRERLIEALAPWLAIVREVAERDPIGFNGIEERECMFCHVASVYDPDDAPGGTYEAQWRTDHKAECLWLRATQLVAGRGTG